MLRIGLTLLRVLRSLQRVNTHLQRIQRIEIRLTRATRRDQSLEPRKRVRNALRTRRIARL